MTNTLQKNTKKESKVKGIAGRKENHTLTYIVLVIFTLIYILPILWMTISSFKSGTELFSYPPKLLPSRFTLENYIDAWNRGDFSLYFKNTTIVAVSATLLPVVINTMAGYAFAKYKFKGSTVIFMFFLATMMLPLEVLMIPIFQVIRTFKMYNNFWGLIIPCAATPAGVFLVRQYFLTIPNELMESARIDGASETRIFLKLMIPLAKPIMSVLAIFSFLWRWNDYMWPLVVIRDTQKYTVQLALANFSGQYAVDWGSLLAMSVLTMIPVLVIFLLFQKQFMKGMIAGAVKG